jgi:hypothetical protein
LPAVPKAKKISEWRVERPGFGKEQSGGSSLFSRILLFGMKDDLSNPPIRQPTRPKLVLVPPVGLMFRHKLLQQVTAP